MNDAYLGIDYIFKCFVDLFGVITSNWLLSSFLFTQILFLIATIYVNARNK